MSLGLALAGFLVLFLLAYCIHRAWCGFFQVGLAGQSVAGGAIESSPEWLALLAQRREIENDPVLDEQTRKLLVSDWQAMANESRPYMTASSVSPSANGGSIIGSTGLSVLVVAVLALALLLTYFVGAFHAGAFTWPQVNSGLAGLAPSQNAPVPAADHPGDGANLQDRLAGLQARLENQPDDLRGWVLLARTHASMSNFADSVAALKKALALSPGHPDILADLADMTAMTQGRQLQGEPEQYIAAALQSDPRNEKALALAASAAEQAGNPDRAQVYWQLLSQVQQAALTNPSEGRAGVGEQSDEAVKSPAEAQILAKVTIDIPRAALDQMNSNSALFVVLKSQAGPGKPLAVVRVPALQLGVGVQQFEISLANLIDPSTAGQLPATLHVQARLSVSGMAQATPADIQTAAIEATRSQLLSGVDLTLPDGAPKP